MISPSAPRPNKKKMNKIVNRLICFFKEIFKKTPKKSSSHWSIEIADSINNYDLEIKDDILNIPRCYDNLKKLEISFEKNKDTFVSFIGAGTSFPTGIPTWEELIGELCKVAHISYKESDDLYKKASEAKRKLKIAGKLNEYYKCLEIQMENISTHGTQFHSQVVDVFKRHITLNFDHTAFKYFLKKNPRPNSFQACPILSIANFDDASQPFVFLHGHIGSKFIILEEEIYDHYYPNVSGEWGSKEIELFLKAVCQKYSIVFFGISFADKYLFQTFKKILIELKQDQDATNRSNPHFLFIDSSAVDVECLNLLELSRKVSLPDIKVVRREFIEKGYIDDTGNFMIDKFNEFINYTGPDQILRGYLNNFGNSIRDWFQNFQSINVNPIIYKKDKHKFVENVLFKISEKGEK